MVASMRAPRITTPLSSSFTMRAASLPPACWVPATDRLTCGGISVCVHSRSSSRAFS